MFNIRVYGVLINDRNEVLVSDEWIRGEYITKFCGGGLEAGEGTRQCLEREFLEEMNLRIEVHSHLYTTDYYQRSAFNPQHQIISVYYYVRALEEIKAPLRTKPFDFDNSQIANYHATGETETFRFISIKEFSEDSVTLPIDKIVAKMIKNRHRNDFMFLGLENDRVRLEPLEQFHFPKLLPCAMHKELWLYTQAKVNSESDFEEYFNEAIQERNSRISFPFAVFDKQFQEYAGSTRYAALNPQNKRLEIGWTWYAPKFQRTGINVNCKSLLLSYGFETLGLNRIELKTSIHNQKSQQAMERLGAVKEGIFRNHIVNADGTLRDTVYYSYINTEWQTIKEKYFGNFKF